VKKFAEKLSRAEALHGWFCFGKIGKITPELLEKGQVRPELLCRPV
jgi:hypothetical protein